MTTKTATKYNVGGVALDLTFKIRRLGHFGFNAWDFEASRHFYFDLLGFFVTEPAGAGFFGRHAGDHHRSVCSTRKSSTSANTPAPMSSISGRRTISTRSPGRFRVFPRRPRRASIFAASASRHVRRPGWRERLSISSVRAGAG
jgi:catechol-2,3-dioxygenase